MTGQTSSHVDFALMLRVARGLRLIVRDLNRVITIPDPRSSHPGAKMRPSGGPRGEVAPCGDRARHDLATLTERRCDRPGGGPLGEVALCGDRARPFLHCQRTMQQSYSRTVTPAVDPRRLALTCRALGTTYSASPSTIKWFTATPAVHPRTGHNLFCITEYH